MIPDGTFVPYNAQATLHSKEVISRFQTNFKISLNYMFPGIFWLAPSYHCSWAGLWYLALLLLPGIPSRLGFHFFTFQRLFSLAGASLAFLPPLVSWKGVNIGKYDNFYTVQYPGCSFLDLEYNFEVKQDRNVHDYLADLDSEVPLYMKVSWNKPGNPSKDAPEKTDLPLILWRVQHNLNCQPTDQGDQTHQTNTSQWMELIRDMCEMVNSQSQCDDWCKRC